MPYSYLLSVAYKKLYAQLDFAEIFGQHVTTMMLLNNAKSCNFPKTAHITDDCSLTVGLPYSLRGCSCN